jgi:hypothetical protein
MPIILTCPNGHKLSVADEHAGKQAMCAICRALMVVPAPPLAPPPVYPAAGQELPPIQLLGIQKPRAPGLGEPGSGSEAMEVVEVTESPSTFRVLDADEQKPATPVKPRPRKRARAPGPEHGQTREEKLSLVNLGLGFHYARLVVILVCILLWMVMFLVMASGGSLGLVLFLEIVYFVGTGAVAPVLALTGSILCQWTPGESGSRHWIVLSLTLDCLQFLLIPIFFLAQVGLGGVFALMLFGFLFFVASWVFFMIFLSTLAHFLDQPGIGNEATRLMVKGLALLGGFIMMLVLMFALIQVALLPVAFLTLILMLVWFVAYINFLFELLNLIGSLRQVIASRW